MMATLQRFSWQPIVLLAVLLLIVSSPPARANLEEDDTPIEMAGQARTKLPQTSRQITSKPILVEPLYKFTANLYGKIKTPEKNLIFSPLSMQFALNMLGLGVTKSSQTEKDLKKTLGYRENTTAAEIHETNAQLRAVFDEIKKASSGSRRNPKLDMINFAIIKNDIKPEYLNQTSKYYGAAVRSAKSASEQQQVSNEVNKWGKEAGFSTDVLKPEDLAKADLTLLNGVRVEAYWPEEFYEINATTNSPLYKVGVSKTGENSAPAKLALYSHEMNVGYVEFTKNKLSPQSDLNNRTRATRPEAYDDLSSHEFRAIKLPLIGDITYTIIEPLAAKATSTDLAKLGDALFAQTKSGDSKLGKVMTFVDKTSAVANVQMPAFKYEHDIDLVAALKSMGLSRIFNSTTADLHGISPKDPFVDQVKHQAMIEVNEKGLKAAAVTRVAVGLMAILHNRVIDVKVENPFLYVIRLDEVPLFVGHLVKV